MSVLPAEVSTVDLIETDEETASLVPWDLSDPFVQGYLLDRERERQGAIIDRGRRRRYLIQGDGCSIGEAELVDIQRRAKVAELRICLGAPGSRGIGIGRQVVARLLEVAERDLGLEEVYLRVQEDNLRAIRCYERCGFRRVGWLPPGGVRSQGLFLMERRLKGR